MLTQFLTEETVRLHVPAHNWRQAVHAALLPLEETGAVTPAYADDVIEMLERVGPYMVVAPGIALVHARPGPNVMRVCLSLVRLEAPVTFGSQENDPVDLLVGLGATDANSHMTVLSQLADLLGDQQSVTAIRQATAVNQILALIERQGGDSETGLIAPKSSVRGEDW